jgi:hypothetical protein
VTAHVPARAQTERPIRSEDELRPLGPPRPMPRRRRRPAPLVSLPPEPDPISALAAAVAEVARQLHEVASRQEELLAKVVALTERWPAPNPQAHPARRAAPRQPSKGANSRSTSPAQAAKSPLDPP